MSILSRSQLEKIDPGGHGHYQGLLSDLKETALHFQGMTDPEVAETDKMRVIVFQDDDGNTEYYCGDWIRIEVYKPEDINNFPDEELPIWMKRRELSRPNYSRRPNLTTEQCLHEYVHDKEIERERRKLVIKHIVERPEGPLGEYNEVTETWEWKDEK